MKRTGAYTWGIVGLLSLSVLAGCKKDPVDPVPLGYEFYPLRVGHWVEYEVDSMWRDDVLNVHDSVSYRLLERVYETYTDAEGRTAYRIRRYVADGSGEWQVRDVWTSYMDERYAEKTEENKRRLKLSFPVREARTWDVNVYNSDEKLEVAYRELDEPWASDSLSFEKSVMVRNVLPANSVIRRDYEEYYVREVGMVQKRWEESNSQTTGVRGFRMRMVAVAYGDQ